MGPIMPGAGREPSEPKQGSAFPSITRAEQAQDTQGVVREIARDHGWESPRSLPKADGTGGLAEGTPLATIASLTPGQKARIGDLPQPSLGVSVKALEGMVGREDPATTRVESYAAQAARREHVAADHRNGDRQLGDGTRVSSDGATGARIYHSTNSGVESATYPTLREINAVRFKVRPPDINQDVLGIEQSEAKRHEGHTKRWMADRIKEHRYAAGRLYERDPGRYASISQQEFITLFSEYMKDEDKLSTVEEAEIGDESAQVAQIERIIAELGPDADVGEVLTALSKQADIPIMPRDQTFEDFIAKVLENKRASIELAKAKARQIRIDMANKYGGEAPIDAAQSIDGADDPHYDGRGYN